MEERLVFVDSERKRNRRDKAITDAETGLLKARAAHAVQELAHDYEMYYSRNTQAKGKPKITGKL